MEIFAPSESTTAICLGLRLRHLPLLLMLPTLLLLVGPFPPQGSSAKVIRRRMGQRIKSTRYGKVQGVLVEFPNRHLRDVEAYLGLRYADLDEGGMRFMPPKNPKEQWNGVRMAFDEKPVCPQPIKHEREFSEDVPSDRATHLRNITPFVREQTEDCLSLNLYVPFQEWNNTTPMAVMVYVHGESYATGTGNAYDGSVLASFGQVIVVTINYRLGVMGFLSTGDDAAMGNYGMIDVTQALLWLRDNIATFDGDPNRVTLFGHGTGAAIVNLLMLSPFVSEGSGNFFQRAILQSGSADSTWAVSYDPTWCTKRLAVSVNCSQHLTDWKALVHCLRKRSYEELVNSAPKAPKYYSCFAPSIDRWSVLPAEVDQLVKEHASKFASVPVMFGITKNEAYAYLKQSEIRKGISQARKKQIIRTYVQNVFRYHRQKIYEILDYHYTDWTDALDPLANRDSILELLSDGQFVSPLLKMANAHAETAETYLYSFSYSTQSESKDKLQGIHGDELPYVFGAPLVDGISPFPSSYTSTEKMMSHALMTYWTNFAKTGDPNTPSNQSSTVALNNEKVNNRFFKLNWPKYTKDSQEYMSISRRPSTRHHYRAQKLALWQELIPKINRDDGSDPKSHLLDDWDDMSTFDDSDNLVTNSEDIFPSPPPMPPSRPMPPLGGGGGAGGAGTSMNRNNSPSGVTIDYGPGTGTGNPLGGNGEAAGDSSSGDKTDGGEGTDDGNEKGVTSEMANKTNVGSKTSAVPLSMVVAIGGSLLLINILIFAGLCYQRERIRKMRLVKTDDGPELTFEEARFHRKFEQDSSAHNSVCGGAHGGGGARGASECMSLMSTGSLPPHQRGQSPRKNSIGLTHVHNPSPQPSDHNNWRAPSQTRSTPPVEVVSCSYAPLPTNVASPTHRPSSRGVSGTGVAVSAAATAANSGGSSVGGHGGGHGSSSSDAGITVPASNFNHSPCNHSPGGGTYVNSKNRSGQFDGSGHPTTRPMVLAPGEKTLNANGGDRVVGGSSNSAFVAPGSHTHSKNMVGTDGGPLATSGSGGGSGSVGLSTFGPGYQRVGKAPPRRDGGLAGGGVDLQMIDDDDGGGGGVGGGGNDSEAVYKTINKSGPNNAVTIV